MSSMITGMAFVSICIRISNDQGSFHVVQDYWNAAFVSMDISTCNDMGPFYVIQDHCNASCVSIFTNICNDMDHCMSYMVIGMQPLYQLL